MFANARNVVFAGNPTFTYHANESISGQALAPLDDGIKILLQKVAPGAMHNSGERFDAPTCHLETRTALQDDVYGWVDEIPSRQLATWMYGPAGAGKSAIAQTVSEKLHAKGQLSASFFFSRTSTSKGRGDESALIATLAYQLCLSDPATKPLIARAVRENPLIFDLSLDDQVQVLIVQPLTAVYEDSEVLQQPKVFVVDGLDECRKDQNAQNRVVSALIKGISSIPQRSHKLFITSRPEHSIVATFENYKPDLLRKTELNEKWNPDDDVRAFLNAGFADIRRSHPYFKRHSEDKTWPSHVDINTLVRKSSGQFIYASVAIKYIKSEDYYDPAGRLEVILDLKNNEDRPYAELDALYHHIFSQCRDVEKVLSVLSLEHMYSENKLRAPIFTLAMFLSYFIGAHIDEIKFWLHPLASLLVWQKGSIRYMHASLPDFLLDQGRSTTFCTYSTSIVTRVVRRALDLLQERMDWLTMSVLLGIPPYFTKGLPPQYKIHVHSMISNFNFVEDVLSRMDAGHISDKTTTSLTSYLDWVLTEFESDNPVECRNALADPVAQIQTWMIQHLKNESFGGTANTDEVDVSPFFIYMKPFSISSGEDLRRQLYTDALLALRICDQADPSCSTAREDVDVSDQTVLLCCLISCNLKWLSRADLLGRHAMTSDRYATALMRTSRYLLRLPKDRQAEGLDDTNSADPRLSASMILASKVFSKFMRVIPQSVELYFLVLYMRSVVKDYKQNTVKKVIRGPKSYHEAIALMRSMSDEAKLYLSRTRSHFPVLDDPKSPGYAREKANAEEFWQIKRDFPIKFAPRTLPKKSRKSGRSSQSIE